jgi:hypothetical protein
VKTSDLIGALAADSDVRTMAPGRALALALIPGFTLALTLLLAIFGLRPHLFALLGEPRIFFKIGLNILLAVLSCRLALRLATPGARLRGVAFSLAVVPALLAAAVVAEFLCVQQNLWGERMIGANAAFCLKTIPLLAAAPLTGTLLALRQGAPENPGLAGAAAGLFAGAIGAALYATHCPDDSPLFVAAWYSVAICFVVIAGALVGRRLLRW